MPDSARSELKQLPVIALKAVGGIATAMGAFAAVFMYTRTPGRTAEIILSLAIAAAGLALFVIGGRALKKSGVPAESTLRESALSWLILLVLAGLFILAVYLMGRG